MACDPDCLRVVGYAGGFTLWHYGDPGAPMADDRNPGGHLLAPGHFDPAAGLLRAGDFILASGGGAHAVLVVAEVEAGRVFLTPMAVATAPKPSRRRRRPAVAPGTPTAH